MNQTIQFIKMHGVGNDYIFVDTSRYPIENPEALSIAWSRYHMGIGSDGLVLIGRSTTPDADSQCASSMPMAPRGSCAVMPADASASMYMNAA